MARKRQPKPKSDGTHPAPAARQRRSAWAGVRFREPGRWAAEIRVPGSRCNAKVWIGAFASDKQAALAYDAAIFCMHGDNLPKTRKFNFPDVARPDIPEHVRLELTVAGIKDIARKHVHGQMGFVLPPPQPTAENNLQVAAAVEVKAEEGTSANGSLDGMDGSFEEITSVPFVFDPVELAAMMDLVYDDDN